MITYRLNPPSTSWIQSLSLFGAWTSVSLPWTSWSLKKRSTHCHEGKEVNSVCQASAPYNSISVAWNDYVCLYSPLGGVVVHRYPPALNSPVLIYTPGWRKALWQWSVLPKNTTQCLRPWLELNRSIRCPTSKPWDKSASHIHIMSLIMTTSWSTVLCKTETAPSQTFRRYWRSVVLLLKLQ